MVRLLPKVGTNGAFGAIASSYNLRITDQQLWPFLESMYISDGSTD